MDGIDFETKEQIIMMAKKVKATKYPKKMVQEIVEAKARALVEEKARREQDKKDGKFNTGDKVLVMCDNGKTLGNSSIMFKSGVIIGKSLSKRNKFCIEFSTPIIKGNSSNSARFTGKPFQCFYVYDKYLQHYSKEVVDGLNAMKESKVQEEIDEWYAPEERYF